MLYDVQAEFQGEQIEEIALERGVDYICDKM
jgi:hypothetical protein